MAESGVDVHKLARENSAQLLRNALVDNPSLLTLKDSDGRNVLQNAVGSVSPSSTTIQTILDLLESEDGDTRKKVLENRDDGGSTALISAASAGNAEVLNLLLGAGADPTATTSKGLTALHYAASKGHVNVGHPCVLFTQTALIIARQLGRTLISKGADINARDSASQLPLHRAATVGALPFVRLILASESPSKPTKPRLNLLDRGGNTPLHLAIESGHAEVAVALIEAGADRHRTDPDGKRPEEIDGVGGQEAKKVREYIAERCGPLGE